jgi:centrin-1
VVSPFGISLYANYTLADAELLEMIERADTDADGEISPDEFYAIMTKKTFT